MKIIVLLLLITSMYAGGVRCSERITNLILHSDGNVYFRSDDTCPSSWCKIAWGSEEKNTRAYSMLLTAVSSKKKVIFYWTKINSCYEKNKTYASPDFIILQD